MSFRPVFDLPRFNWYPGHMAKAAKDLKDKIKLCDLMIEVRDARVKANQIPFSSANLLAEELSARKPRLVVLNKIDLSCVSYTKVRARQKLATSLDSQGICNLMMSASENKNITGLIKRIKDMTKPKFATVGTWVLITGLPNVGKSSLLNALRTKSKEFDNSEK